MRGAASVDAREPPTKVVGATLVVELCKPLAVFDDVKEEAAG